MPVILNFPSGDGNANISSLGSIITINFDPEFIGHQFTVSDSLNDTKEYTVPEGGISEIIVKNCSTEYTIKSIVDDVEYTSTFRTKEFFGQITTNLHMFKATINITAVDGAIVEATCENKTYKDIASDGVAVIEVRKKGNYSIKGTINEVYSDVANVNVVDEITYIAKINFITLTLTSPIDSEITIEKGEEKIFNRISTGLDKFYLSETGDYSVTISKDGETSSNIVKITEYKNYDLELAYVHIYGASWDGTSRTDWTRTDDAKDFGECNPYYASMEGEPSSPFDNIMPWSGMIIEKNRIGGDMVKIPKFWYKLTQNSNNAGMTIQIANGYVDGFSVSPAHMKRFDEDHERDVVYIGRYHCGNNYKSNSGEKTKVYITRSTARTEIHKLGENIWQSDFAMRFTIWLLYIVEFANWNSQEKIGYGCGNNSSAATTGYTDDMTYHTGTIRKSRNIYGLGTQYRYIEGLWDNAYDWCDGCYNNNNGLNIIINPKDFRDNANGTSVGIPTSGYPSAFSVKTEGGFPMFIPTATSDSNSTYSCDIWTFNISRPCIFVGGSYNNNLNLGLFYVDCISVSESNASVGCRLMELPN